MNVLEATRRGDASLLKKLIKQGYSVDIKDNNGYTAFHEAAIGNHFTCLELLINSAPSLVNSKSFNSATPVLLSARNTSVDCLNLLLQNGADPNICDFMGESPLYAAINCSADMATTLLQKGANVNAKTYDGTTPLLQAVDSDLPGMIRLLMSYGADASEVNEHGMTPLFKAAQHRKIECLKVLINILKENLPSNEVSAVVNTQAIDGCTALFIATQSGSLECVMELLSSSANPNLPLYDTGSLSLHIALQNNNTELIHALLPLTSRDVMYNCTFSPFYFTFRDDGDTTAFNLLVQHGYDLLKKSNLAVEIDCLLFNLFPSLESLKFSPLSEAAVINAPPIYSNILINLGAIPWEVDVSEECSPFLAALCRDNLSLAAELLRFGVKVNVHVPGCDFNLSLFASSFKDTLKFVFKCGANVEGLLSIEGLMKFINLYRNAATALIKRHLEVVLIWSIYTSNKTLPNEIIKDLSLKGQKCISGFSGSPRSLRSLCRNVIRSFFQPSDFAKNLQFLQPVFPPLLINFLLFDDLSEIII